MVVSYWNSTSNHNSNSILYKFTMLYLIEILHQTTTTWPFTVVLFCCILLKFYIKPQPKLMGPSIASSCILLKFYIKPQLKLFLLPSSFSCILLKFYIKPQHCWYDIICWSVVSYWNSTSNHNFFWALLSSIFVVSYWNSTSNHNCIDTPLFIFKVVSYWNSTSNHNHWCQHCFQTHVVSYWNSTSNHNFPH